ncbi:hypothetical protein MBLNU459_g3374t1 [Dothideomycetes sp. NU459]
MAEVAVPSTSSHRQSQPRPIDRGLRITPPNERVLPPSVRDLRSGHLTLDTFSPVNQNGSFEFDRVIKSGAVHKRTRKTKSWRTIHMVLRPNLLSIYRDKEETKLRHQITLSDLTAVARQKDPKGKAKHVFALFSPSRNFHLEAPSDREAQEWVELIRREARIDEDEEEMTLASPGGAKSTFHGFERHSHSGHDRMDDRNTGYSSSELEATEPRSAPKPHHSKAAYGGRRPSHTLEYSGPEQASYSDFSDSAGAAARMSALSLSSPENLHSASVSNGQYSSVYGPSPRMPLGNRNPSQMSGLNLAEQQRPAPAAPKQDEERVVCHGWIFLLKSKSGVRQWKKLWLVLRPKALALYKNEEEYSALLVIPFGAMINAVEIDPISRSKRYCLQIITEERNYRLCAPDDDALARWLGAFKSLLVKRKEVEMQRVALAGNQV